MRVGGVAGMHRVSGAGVPAIKADSGAGQGLAGFLYCGGGDYVLRAMFARMFVAWHV